MNPTSEAIAKIQGRVLTWEGRTDEEIASELNTPAFPNPEPQGTVPAPLTVPLLIAALGDSPAKRVAVSKVPGFQGALDAVNVGYRAGVLNWLQLLEDWIAAGELSGISVEDVDALRAVVNATIPDPEWPAEVSWAELNLGRAVDAADVAASRP